MLHGDMSRDESTYGFVIKWEVRKVLPFQAYGEADVLEAGTAGTYEVAGERLGKAMARQAKAKGMRVQ